MAQYMEFKAEVIWQHFLWEKNVCLSVTNRCTITTCDSTPFCRCIVTILLT